MYRIAFYAFKNNWHLFAVFAILASILPELPISRPLSLVFTVFISGYVAFFSHRMVLLGERYSWDLNINNTAGNKSWSYNTRSFTWRFFLLTTLFISLIIIPFILLFNGGVINSQDEEGIYASLFLLLFLALPFYGIVLFLLGTILPASATEGDAGLKLALQRGHRTFWKTLLRLLVGNVLFTIVLWTTVTIIVLKFESLLPGSYLVTYGLSFLASLGGNFGILLAATALSMAYQETEDINVI